MERLELIQGREVRAAGKQDVRRFDLILNFFAEHSLMKTPGVQEAHDGPYIYGLTDSGLVERVEDARQRGQTRWLDQQAVGAPLEQQHQ